MADAIIHQDPHLVRVRVTRERNTSSACQPDDLLVSHENSRDPHLGKVRVTCWKMVDDQDLC
jgi:hypothetical protein